MFTTEPPHEDRTYFSFFHTQFHLLGKPKSLIRSRHSLFGPQYRLFARSLAFDESLEKLMLVLNSITLPQLPQHRRSSWHVLVSMMRAAVVTYLDGYYAVFSVQDILRPHFPVAANSAECLDSGLFHADAVQPYNDWDRATAHLAKDDVFHWDAGGATSNDKLIAHEMACAPASQLCSKKTCGNHHNSLVEYGTIDSCDADILPSMYRTALLLRMGGSFLRCIQACEVFAKRVRLVCGRRAAAGSNVFGEALRDFAVRSHMRSSGAKLVVEDHEAPASKALTDAWNGLFSLVVITPFCLTHYSETDNFDPAILWSQVAWYLALTVWHAMPTVPAKSKWTKLGPCATFHFLGQATGGALAACIDPDSGAFSRLRLLTQCV